MYQICHRTPLQGLWFSQWPEPTMSGLQVILRWRMATYNGWLHSHFISSVIIFSSKGFVSRGNTYIARLTLVFWAGEIIASCINCPGSWHDSHIAEGIYKKLENKTPNRYCLVADLAFPQRSTIGLWEGSLSPSRLPLPLDNEQWENTPSNYHNLSYSYHQTAEWGMCTSREALDSSGYLWQQRPRPTGDAD